jgi:ketosteroid isomerase-like protein
MTSNQERAMTLVRALHAAIDRDGQTLRETLTDDVRAWSPALSTASLDELLDELDRRDGAFADVELNVTALDVGGDHACVEWTVEMTHSGPIVLADDLHIESSGLRVAMHGITVAEFLGDQICSLRQYWDELTVFEQLGALTQRAEP